jgi:hypothetical protein
MDLAWGQDLANPDRESMAHRLLTDALRRRIAELAGFPHVIGRYMAPSLKESVR